MITRFDVTIDVDHEEEIDSAAIQRGLLELAGSTLVHRHTGLSSASAVLDEITVEGWSVVEP